MVDPPSASGSDPRREQRWFAHDRGGACAFGWSFAYAASAGIAVPFTATVTIAIAHVLRLAVTHALVDSEALERSACARSATASRILFWSKQT